MQSENEINDQFRVLKAKSSKTKPFGFAMIVAGEDGKPLIYFDRKINGARASAKAELKTAKKKKLVCGFAFIDGDTLHLAKGPQPIPAAIVQKALKELAKVKSRYKSCLLYTSPSPRD